MWGWSVRRLCNEMHVQLIAECSDEEEAQEMQDTLTLSPDDAEEKSRLALTQQMLLSMPGAIQGG